MVRKITKTKIISCYLDDYNKRFYLGELSNLLKKPHQTIKSYAEELVKENIVLKNKKKKNVEYFLNLNNPQIWDYIIISEKEKLNEKLKESILLSVLYEKLSKFFETNTFIIFGSTVKELGKKSDIDLLVLGPNKEKIKKELEKFGDSYNRDIHITQISDLKNPDQTFIKEIYQKHLILNNTEKIIRFFGGFYEKNILV